MPRKRKKTRKTYKAKHSLVDLKLLRLQLLSATLNFTDYYSTKDDQEHAHAHMLDLLKRYKAHRDSVKAYFTEVFDYLMNDKAIGENITPEQAKEVKKKINEIAKKVWKKRG